MWSSNLKPHVKLHGHLSKHNEYIYVVEIFVSSFMAERHVFFSKRKYLSFLSHVSKVLPLCTRFTSSLSYLAYYDYYSDSFYDQLTNL